MDGMTDLERERHFRPFWYEAPCLKCGERLHQHRDIFYGGGHEWVRNDNWERAYWSRF